jgi:hypothetical protein
MDWSWIIIKKQDFHGRWSLHAFFQFASWACQVMGTTPNKESEFYQDYCNVMIIIFFMITNNKFLDCFTSNSYKPWWFHTQFLTWAHFKKLIDGPYLGIMYLSHFLPSFQIALKVYVKVQWVKPWASRGVTSEHIEDLKYHP